MYTPTIDVEWGVRFNITMNYKSAAIEAIKKLPKNATLKDIQERIAYLDAIEKGLEQLEKGRTVSLDAVKKKISKWTSK